MMPIRTNESAAASSSSDCVPDDENLGVVKWWRV